MLKVNNLYHRLEKKRDKINIKMGIMKGMVCTLSKWNLSSEVRVPTIFPHIHCHFSIRLLQLPLIFDTSQPGYMS